MSNIIEKLEAKEPDQTCPALNRLLSELKDLSRYISNKKRYAEGEALEILDDVESAIWSWDSDIEEIRKQNIALRDWGNLCLGNIELKEVEL